VKKLRILWAIPVLLLLLIPLPVYADEGCDGDCDMEVNIGVSGNSEVNVSTGANSEVGVFPGENNNVYINGQDINEPTVIHTTHTQRSQSYSMIYSQRLSKLEGWRTETIAALQITMDGLAKLIMISEGKNGELEALNQRLEGILLEATSQEGELASLQTEIAALDAEKDTEISDLKYQIELLKWQAEQDKQVSMWLIIGLIAGLSVVGGLMIHRTRY